jgi:hypothetical protein
MTALVKSELGLLPVKVLSKVPVRGNKYFN